MLLMLIIIPDLLVVRLVPCGILYLIRVGGPVPSTVLSCITRSFFVLALHSCAVLP